LENPKNWRHRTCIGRPFSGPAAAELGLCPSRSWFIGLTVWAMGDKNSVDVAQATHRSLLKQTGALTASDEMLYNCPMPRGPVYEGLYIDDHVIVCKAQYNRPQDPARLRAQELLQKSRAGYVAAQLPRAEAKGFEEQETFIAWGTEVCSKQGTCGAPRARRRQLMFLVGSLLVKKKASKEMMQTVLGSFVHPFMHRRLCMSSLGRAYNWAQNLPAHKLSRIPHDVWQELFAGVLLLGFAHTDLRAPVSTLITSSDATPSSVGVVAAKVSRDYAEGLFDYSEQKGGYVRLDWSYGRADLTAWSPNELPADMVEVYEGCRWDVVDKVEYRESQHVNLRELTGSKRVLIFHADRSVEPERLANGVDSKVALGALAKGRSSSKRLNKTLQQCLAWSLVAQKYLAQFWLPTDKNYGDYPSRGKEPPAPLPVRKELQRLCRPERAWSGRGLRGSRSLNCFGLEVFGGEGGLSRALNKLGFEMDLPLEAFPALGGYRPEHDLRRGVVRKNLRVKITGGTYRYVHFGIPCTRFSRIQQMNGGSRSKANPAGDENDPRDREANEMAHVVCLFCRLVAKTGGFFSIENPLTSFLWGLAEYEELMKGFSTVDFDQCMFGLAPPHVSSDANIRMKKATRIVTNCPGLSCLAVKCDGSHAHHHCLGSVQVGSRTVSTARYAGAYPARLCEAWARGVIESCCQG
jgi:hypothetical protein